MASRYFSKKEFDDNFGDEISLATDVYKRRQKDDINDYALAKYDFVFISDAKEKLTKLGEFLATNYSYKVKSPEDMGDYWELAGDSIEFPVDQQNLTYWALDLYCKGYEFDCKLDAYGAMSDPDNQLFLNLNKDNYGYYFDLAMEAYNKRNFGMSIIHFSTAIRINPNDPNSWYSRAIMKGELLSLKAARKDYDKAIELAPNFTDAIINRAANKDEAGEYDEAIIDYTNAIGINPNDEMAYFNRGNSKLNKGDKVGACNDWNKAFELGADYAKKMIDNNCK